MGEKNNGEQTENKNGGKNNVNTVVLKADLHCDGCASKVLKCIRNFDGVETATIGEGLITVAGKIDPAKLRGKVEQKTHKRVELISPQPKKDNNNGENIDKKEKKKENNNGENNKENVKAKENNGNNKKTKDTKPPVTTAVMKVHLHCEGCIHKISKIITKTKGYEDMKIDRQKELVTVTGAIDMKALANVLKKHLKKDVEVLPPEKKAEKKETKGGGDKDKNEKNAGDEKKKKKKKNSGGDGGDGMAGGGGGGERKLEENRMQVHAPNPNPNPNPFVYAPGGEQFYYNPYAVGPYHAPQIFSDENPNACVVM